MTISNVLFFDANRFWRIARFGSSPLLVGVVLVGLLVVLPAQAQSFRYDQTPLRTVFNDLHETTGYRFLYRDALVAGRSVTLAAEGNAVFDRLHDDLRRYNLGLRVDDDRKQVLVYETAPTPPAVLTGHVLDAETGTHLPFATITWRDDGQIRGVAADESGLFRIDSRSLPDAPSVVLSASYVGYAVQSVAVDPHEAAALSIRLQPDATPGQEVVVTGTFFHSDLDTTWHALIRPDLYAPLGEASVLRALQPLPSVALGPAFGAGLTVRGSQSDGFQVLLDGAAIYNQQHFFGLFDAFNEDALQTVGFFYDVTPAQYSGPPGGTLSFATRTGAQTGFRSTVGLSNVAARATIEGPLADGRASVLVSGRYSFFDQIGWLGNAHLIDQGLDVDRATSALPDNSFERGQRLVVPGEPSALFYDAHAKLYAEGTSGQRLTLSLYTGLTDTDQPALRVFAAGDGLGGETLDFRTITTQNRWGNDTASLQVQLPMGTRLYNRTLLAISRYGAQYAKGDFPYRRNPSDSLVARRGPFSYDDTLIELKALSQIDGTLAFGSWSGGLEGHQYHLTYEEHTLLRERPFTLDQAAIQLDAFAQLDVTGPRFWNAQLGVRSHYFTDGDFLRVSPRVRVQAWPQGRVSVGAGYSRNYQFLHRLVVQNTTSADVWVLSTADQPPGSVDYTTAGLYLRPTPTSRLQIEAYHKTHRNLRQREISAPARQDAGLLATPWFFDNTAYARGLEMMGRQQLGAASWTASYTLSRVELQNDVVNGGTRFLAEWDRTHQFSTQLQATLTPSFTANVSWLYASGTPNLLAYELPGEPAMLDAYHRMDASVQFRRALGTATLEARVSVFNLYDRDNPWYRDVVGIIDTSQRPRRLSYATVDVYDLGLQPAFDVAVTF